MSDGDENDSDEMISEKTENVISTEADVYRYAISAESIRFAHDDKLQIMKMVKRFDQSKIQRFSDGSRVNLSRLPDYLIKQMYEYVRRRFNLIDPLEKH
jgi:hypothetical protein